jgi:hypothetical protein
MAHRLTFDSNPAELEFRQGGGTIVSLLWSRDTGRAAVVVEDEATGEVAEIEVLPGENPLELFEHPYVYVPTRGRIGWTAAWDELEELAAAAVSSS